MKSMKSNMKTMKSMKAKKKRQTTKPHLPMVKWQNTEHKRHVGRFYDWEVAAAYFSPGSVCISWRGTKLHQFMKSMKKRQGRTVMKSMKKRQAEH
jgi:hypothetical protein